MTTYEGAELEKKVTELKGWSVVGGKLHFEKTFQDFVEAFSFMTRIAFEAEKRNHHPEWSNVYHRVVIDLTTHDAGGVSDKDFELAAVISEAVAK